MAPANPPTPTSRTLPNRTFRCNHAGVAVASFLGFCFLLLAPCANGDALGLDFRLLGHGDRELAVLEIGFDLLRIDTRRQCERAAERAVRALVCVVARVFVAYLARALAFAADGQTVAGQRD